MNKMFGFVASTLLAFLTASAFAQTTPVTGDVTVKLSAGLDSASARPGQVVPGAIVRSTNRAVAFSAPAIVQLTGDSQAGFGVQIVRLNVGGQMTPVGSTPGAATGFSKFIGMTQAGAPKVSASGTRVYLPAGTEVKFTLAAPAAQPPPQPEAARQGSIPTTPRLPRLSETAWTLYPDQGGVVPDVAVIVDVALMNGTDEKRKIAVQLGCDDRNGTKQPVIRFILPHTIKFDLSQLGNTPTTVRSKDHVVMQLDVSTSTDDRLFLGNRMLYFAKRTPGYDLVQYDADPRELGSFGDSKNVGKTAFFRIGDIDSKDINLKVPPVTDAVTAILNACGAAPYSGTSQLSEQFAAQALILVGPIVAYRGQQGNLLPEQRALDDIVITTPEFNAAEALDSFKNVIVDENAKRKGRPVPPRRQRCADAFTAQFKAKSFPGYASACAYVAKEAPE